MAGFECEFVEKPPKAVQSECPICLLVLREPYQATCCGKSFCKECIERINANNQDCPTCNDKNFNLFHNLGLQQSLNDFEVYCSHKSKGCEWRGELRELDKHLNSDPPADKSLEGCPFTFIKCPLCCASSCEKTLYRRDIKGHVKDNLLSTQMKAFEQQLQEVHSVNAQLTAQLQEVILVTEQLQRNKHIFEQRIKDLEERVCRLDVKPSMVSNSKPAPDQPSSKQPSTYLTGTVKPTGAEFTMTGFEEYKRENDVWFSPHFYTHSGGYKMCLAVYANGDTTGKYNHLSVRIRIMRGEFDDRLKWPFRGDITVELISQEKDGDHHVKSLPFRDASADTSSRVVGQKREMAKHGWGFSQFIPHTELRPKYLKNDCIKLRIKKILLV